MTPVRTAHRRYPRRVARRGKPIVHCRPDPPALDWRVAGAMMPGDQQHDAVSGGDRLLETAIDCAPGGVEVHPVQVEHPIRFRIARAETPIPSPIEGGSVRRTT
jgi:hypothetical protein